jgi:hypothetical protein
MHNNYRYIAAIFLTPKIKVNVLFEMSSKCFEILKSSCFMIIGFEDSFSQSHRVTVTMCFPRTFRVVSKTNKAFPSKIDPHEIQKIVS